MTPYLKALAYRRVERIVRPIAYWDWRASPDLNDLQRRLLGTSVSEHRFDGDEVEERRAAEMECRRLVLQHERDAIIKARQARMKLAEARRQTDGLDALKLIDRARALLVEASRHRGMAAQIGHDIATSHYFDTQARNWKPSPKPRGRPKGWRKPTGIALTA